MPRTLELLYESRYLLILQNKSVLANFSLHKNRLQRIQNKEICTKKSIVLILPSLLHVMLISISQKALFRY